MTRSNERRFKNRCEYFAVFDVNRFDSCLLCRYYEHFYNERLEIDDETKKCYCWCGSMMLGTSVDLASTPASRFTMIFNDAYRILTRAILNEKWTNISCHVVDKLSIWGNTRRILRNKECMVRGNECQLVPHQNCGIKRIPWSSAASSVKRPDRLCLLLNGAALFSWARFTSVWRYVCATPIVQTWICWRGRRCGKKRKGVSRPHLIFTCGLDVFTGRKAHPDQLLGNENGASIINIKCYVCCWKIECEWIKEGDSPPISTRTRCV